MITRASQLENNMSYVACGLEKMKRMGYGSMSNNLLSPRTQLKTREGGTRYDGIGDSVPPQLAKGTSSKFYTTVRHSFYKKNYVDQDFFDENFDQIDWFLSNISKQFSTLAEDITLPPIRIKLPERSEEFVRCHSRNSTERFEMSKKVKTIFSPRLHSRSQSRASPAMKNVYHSEAIDTRARTVADSD